MTQEIISRQPGRIASRAFSHGSQTKAYDEVLFEDGHTAWVCNTCAVEWDTPTRALAHMNAHKRPKGQSAVEATIPFNGQAAETIELLERSLALARAGAQAEARIRAAEERARVAEQRLAKIERYFKKEVN